MMVTDINFSRQTSIFNPENQRKEIILIGAGSTGSFISLTLAKMGFNKIKVIDFDKVEEHNIPNQFYRLEDKDSLKVNALKEIVKDFSGNEIEVLNEEVKEDFNFEEHINLETMVIFCLDNMESRKLIYEKIKDFPIHLIDTRMGGEGYQIYTIDLTNDEEKAEYEKRLEATTSNAPCGEKAIIYTILSIASETCNIIKKLDKAESYPKTIKREMGAYTILSN